jgi:Ca2+-binding RTX toxin-like protein
VAQYLFETIADAQAAAYSFAIDSIVFPAAASAGDVSVILGAGLAIVSYGGRSVTFGAGFTGQTGAIFNDGSRLQLGGSGNDQLTGQSGSDALLGLGGADVLNGGDGSDTLRGGFGDDEVRGGRGVDTLEGGDGADLFMVNQGDTAVTNPDRITDWSSDDQIRINNTPGAYQETSAPDAGRTHANSLIAQGARYVAVQTPQGVIVYIDSAGDGGTAEDAVLLAGRSLDDISGANLGASSTLPTAPIGPAEPAGPPPPVSPTNATNGADILAGGAGAETIQALAGDDNVAGGGGADSISGQDGADTLDGGAGADTINGGSGADRIVIGVGESGITEGAIDRIEGIAAADRLVFAGGGLIDSFMDLGQHANYASALAAANVRIGSGEANFVRTQVGADDVLFVDSRNDDGQADDAVVIQRIVDGFQRSNLVATAPPAPEPETPRAPGAGFQHQSARGTIEGVMDNAHLSRLLGLDITDANANELEISGPGAYAYLGGFGFTFDANEQITGGSATRITYREMAGGLTTFSISVTTPGISASQVGTWVQFDQTQLAFATMLAGGDWIHGGANGDLLRTFAGPDFLEGYGGADTLWGGAGDDMIFAGFSPVQGPPPGQTGVPVGATYLRGEDGNDIIYGAGGFDDINGNMGNDLCVGGLGDDWVVGGKDNDQLFGEAGNDLVYGNLGNDTCVGGDGADIVRGGQDNDLLWGGGGNDYVSGDRGDDTMTGGAGADIFHSFGEAAVDRVTDFSVAQGDRVQLDPGTQYTVAQVGADTVISMTGGGQMTLVGVQMSSLPTGWVFGA